MAFNFKRPPDTPPQYCIFGKLPRRGDFVRVNATHPAAMHLDQLLAGSLQIAAGDAEAAARYRETPPTSFVLRSKDARWLSIGIVQPSHDEGGRNYPLVAASLAPAESTVPSLAILLLANELFFSGLREQLRSAMDNSVEMVACRQYLEEQLAFGTSSSADIELAQQLLERHLAATPARLLDESLAAAGMGSLEAVLLAFLFHHRLLRKFGDAVPAQTYLLPLPCREGEDVLTAVTWLALYQAATAGSGSECEQFMILRRKEGYFLSLLPGALTEQIATQCWGATLDPKFIVDIWDERAPWRSHQSHAEAAYILGRQMNDPALSIAQLRGVMESLSRSVA
ncbi:type VI secretion-associated protein [Xenophilus sp. AP218F]|nr:type VI secretion system-associated protein TagF [Chromobacterium sp. ASV5]OWY37112.1 type VI secretion-associated protein [Xenophilus sp. AP218F]